VTEAEAIARRAAERLGAEMDPALPDGVARVLTRSRRSPDGDLPDGADLATFVVAAAAFGCRLSAGTSGTAEPTRATLERRLRRQFGIDEGMSPHVAGSRNDHRRGRRSDLRKGRRRRRSTLSAAQADRGRSARTACARPSRFGPQANEQMTIDSGRRLTI
jgi:hypothetical protein